MEFQINGFQIKFEDADYESARVLRIFYELAVTSRNRYLNAYEKCGSINKVIKESVHDLKSIYKEVTNIVVGELNRRKVWGITPEIFTSRCLERCNSFSDEIEKVYEIYLDITNQKKMADANRQARKNARGRVVGGGFGLSGAIKGMLVAGTINAVTGTLHSAFDVIDSASSNSSFDKALKELYRRNNVKTSLVNAVYEDIKTMFEIYYEFLQSKYKQLEIIYDFNNVEQAESIKQNILNGVIPEKDIGEALVDMLVAFPALEETYYIVYKLCGTSGGELIKMSEYFGINLDLKAIEQGDNLLVEFFGDDLEKIEYQLADNEYFQEFKYCLNEPIGDLVFKCIEFAKQRGLDSTYTSSIFEFKDYNNRGCLSKAHLSFAPYSNDETPLLFFDTTIFNSGNAGVLLTDKNIYSSKGNLIFPLTNINSIVSEGFYVRIDGTSIPEAYIKKDQAKLLDFLVKVIQYKDAEQNKIYQLEMPSPTMEVRSQNSNYLNEYEICKEIEQKFFTDFKKDSSYGKYFFMQTNLNNEGKNKLRNALGTYARIAEDEKVLMIYDNTMMGSGKEGFLMSNKYIHFKNKYGEGKILLQDIKKIEYKMISFLPNYIINDSLIIPCKFLDHDRLKSFIDVFIDMRDFVVRNI